MNKFSVGALILLFAVLAHGEYPKNYFFLEEFISEELDSAFIEENTQEIGFDSAFRSMYFLQLAIDEDGKIYIDETISNSDDELLDELFYEEQEDLDADEIFDEEEEGNSKVLEDLFTGALWEI